MHLDSRSLLTALAALLVVVGVGAEASAQTYFHTWTSTADFAEGRQVNVNATDPADQLQLNLSAIETPYLWVANSNDHNVARIDTQSGRVLSVTTFGRNINPSRTAVDLDFNCWVAARESDTKLYKIDARTGALIGNTERTGEQGRGVVINANGDVWASTSYALNGSTYWKRYNPQTFQTLQTITVPHGSYGLVIDPYGKMFSPTSWLGGSTVTRVNSENGAVEQVWDLEAASCSSCYFYGITADLNGDVWGGYWAQGGWPAAHYVMWLDGQYNCPNGAQSCTLSQGHGIRRIIDVLPTIRQRIPAASESVGARGLAVDANGFVWAVFNDAGRTGTPSYVVKLDGRTGDPLVAAATGNNTVGITPDADGFIWVVNQAGGGPNLVSHPCPSGFSGNGTVTKLRSSDGSVVATYPTCGNGPYTYSDMAGYHLRAVTLRSGTWRSVHDSGRADLEWGTIRWAAESFDDTTLRLRARAAETEAGLATQTFVEFNSGDALPFRGRFIEVEGFFFTRNDFIGPVLYDLTVSSVCIPTGETCNNFDDDCDGTVDNGNPGGGQGCDTGLQGVCGAGQQVCVRGGYQCQAVNVPANETCDGQDNNCDGRIDEGVTNLCGACGAAPMEVCDGIDNDCDGATDEGVKNNCGACGLEPTEVCDGIDNNCNGLIDEGLTNLCGTCGDAPEEVCDGVDNNCDGLIDEGVTNNCGTCGAEPEELCDGLDNNCNGLADEGLLNGCGTCGPAPEEVCNGVDDNCNGRIDEGVLNACGFCGAPPEEVCDGVDNNCDGAIDEGLANACGGCGPVPEEVCNGVDDDCDGTIDEGVANRCGSCGLVPEEICDGTDNDCDGEVDERVKNACGTCGDLGPDVCDGVDNDCDGEQDEDPDCVEGRTCIEGECAERCAAGECPRGFYCSGEGYCLTDKCLGVSCGGDETCVAGDCLDSNEVACQEVACAGADVCVGGACVPDPCVTTTCDEGQACWLGSCEDAAVVACKLAHCDSSEICDNGTCVADPCLSVRCDVGQACVAGACEDACTQMTCSTGFICRLGQCVEDRCFNISCGDAKVCYQGNCLFPGCETITCNTGEQCGLNGCEPLGTCGSAVCADGEVCAEGRCVPEGSDGNAMVNNGGSDNNGNGDNNGDGGAGNAPGTDSSCACSATDANPATSLLALLLVGLGLLIRR